MFKTVKILISTLIICLSLTAPKPVHAALISEDHPALKFCDSATNIGLILSQYPMPHVWNSIQALPFPPFIAPGIVVGFSTRTAVVVVLCQLLYDIAAGDTQKAIYATGTFLNDQTDRKWDHHLQFADSTWNLANSVYDFESGTQRKGTLKSASTHREINDYMKTSYGWYNKTFNGSDAQLKNRGEREQELNQLSNMAHRRALLTEATNCPQPLDNKNYEKIYATEIKPSEIKKEEAENDLAFLRGKLMEMGPRFMNDQAELDSYIKGVERMISQGVSYQITYKDKVEVSKKPHPTRKNKDGTVVMVDKQVKTKTQVWQSRMFSEIFEEFKKKWSGSWSSWVTAQYVQSSQGLLTNGREKVEAEFMDLNYECNVRRLMQGVSQERADYEKVQEERYNKCIEDTKINQKKAENLLNYYVGQLQNSLMQLKKANATIWTAESWYLGTMRAVNTKDATEGFQQEQVTCAASNELSPAEMDKLKLKQKDVTIQLKGFITKQYSKKTMMMEEEQKAKATQKEEMAKRQAFSAEQGKRSSESLKKNIAPVPVQGGI